MKRSLVFHVVFVSGTYYVSNLLYIIRGVGLAWLLGPAAFGVWASMRVVQTFGTYPQLGTRQSVVQLAALADGRGEAGEAEAVRRNASGINLAAAVLVTVAAAGYGLCVGSWGAEWLAFAPSLLAVNLTMFYQAVLRSHQQYSRAASSDVVVAIVSTTAGLAAAWSFGLLGFVIVLSLAQLAALPVLRSAGTPYPRPRLHRETALRLIACGVPLISSVALLTVMWNVDKLLLWALRSSAELGVYAVQATFTNAALLAPAAVTTVLHPHLMRELGQRKTPESLRPYLVNGSELVAVWSIPVVVVGYNLLHLPIRWWLPQYVATIEPGRILMLAAYLSMMATVPSVVLIALGGQRLLCLIRIAAIAIAAGGGFVGLRYGFHGLALAMGAAIAVDSVLTLAAACHRARLSAREALDVAGRLLLPFAGLLLLVPVGWAVAADDPASRTGDAAATALRTAVMLSVVLPWAAWRSHRLRRIVAGPAVAAPA